METLLLDFLKKECKPDHVDYLKVFKQLRGYFGEVYVGGSYVYSKELDIPWNQKDIDIFILIPRMESWALQNILNLVFDDIHVFDHETQNPKFMVNQDKYYKITHQWKRVIAYKNSMMYDLIFVDSNIYELLAYNTGCDISQMCYSITYNDSKTLQLEYHPPAYDRLMKKKTCYIDMDHCTKAYAKKMQDICKRLDIKHVFI